MKKLLLLCFIVIGGVLFSCQHEEKNVIKIGIIAPLTGYASLPGQMCMKGIEFAKKQISINGKSKYEFFVEDCKSSPKDAIAAFRRLYSAGIKYYIVCGGQFAMAVAPLTKDKEVIMFATATANLDLLSTTNRCFRMFPHPQIVVNTLSNYALNNLKAKKVAIVYIQNDAYALYANLYEKLVIERGGDVVLKEGYGTTQKDFKDIITKVVDANPDYLYLSGMGESALIFSRQMFSNTLSQRIPIFGDMNFSLPNAKNIIGKFPTSIYYVDALINKDFEHQYFNEYNETPNAYSYYPYIIPYIIDEAIDQSESKNILSQIDYIKQHEFSIASDSPIQFNTSGEVNLILGINILK